ICPYLSFTANLALLRSKPHPVSVMVPETVTGTILWFGGQRTVGCVDTVMAGGVLQTEATIVNVLGGVKTVGLKTLSAPPDAPVISRANKAAAPSGSEVAKRGLPAASRRKSANSSGRVPAEGDSSGSCS